MPDVKLLIVAIGIALLSSGFGAASAQCKKGETLIAIGGGYADTYTGFVAAALERLQGDTLKITILPNAYASNADSISDEERADNLDTAEIRRAQLEEACSEVADCEVTLALIFTRSDALDPANLDYFPSDLAAVFLLGGDQTVAMNVLAGTPIEEKLASAYACGLLIAGTSAGEAVQSRVMIGGYAGDFGPETSLREGAVDLWQTDEQRGLSFGLTDAILEQHFWERGRFGRLLNALAQPDVPHIGIGVDGYTAIEVTDGSLLHNVFGLYSVAVLDAETLGAAEASAFKNGILTMHNILFHLLAPGDFSYDLSTRESALASLPDAADRLFDSLVGPAGAGTLILSSGVNIDNASDPIMRHFAELVGGQTATVWIITDEQLSSGDNLADQLTDDIGGIIVTAEDQAAISPDTVAFLKDFWLAGRPLLLNNAASAIAGAFYAAQSPTPESTDNNPYADTNYIQGAFIDGNTTIQPGLGLLNIMVEPRVLDDYRMGRLVALAYAHSDMLAIGLNDGSALEINVDGATVLGTNGLFLLDLRAATLDLGTNNAYVFANGLLDLFAPGEILQ